MVQPHIVVNWIAIFVAVIAGFSFGGIWYGPLFGKAWAQSIGLDTRKKPEASTMKRAFALQIIGLVLISYVLTHTSQAWRPLV